MLEQAPTYDFFSAAVVAILGVVGAAQNQAFAPWAVLAVILVFGSSCRKVYLNLSAARKLHSTHELEGCLYTLRAVLEPGPDCLLRLAVHVPSGDDFVQVTDYVGAPPKVGRVGRRFPSNAGIIGKAYREQNVFHAKRANDDYEAYVRELVTDWNYTEERARKLNPAAMAWMALPLYDPDKQRVQAVLFIDVNQRDFFTDERQEVILSGLNGIALFVGKRYA